MSNGNGLTQLVAHLHAMRTQMFNAIFVFYEALEKAEQEGVWCGDRAAGTGYTTFSEFLTVENLCAPHLFDKFKLAVARFGRDMVASVGVEQACSLLPVPSDAPSISNPSEPAVDVILRAALESRERNGQPPSPRHFDTLKRLHYAPPPRDRAGKSAEPASGSADDDIVSRLRAENQRLVAENAELRAENERLRAEAASAPKKHRSSAKSAPAGAA